MIGAGVAKIHGFGVACVFTLRRARIRRLRNGDGIFFSRVYA